ncbi:MAG: ABC transporter ATP-binding protein [Cyanobacteria bacterium P01_D01_bin.105]
MVAALELHGLRKQFGSHRAVDGLSLSVAPGVLYAFLGANGAGKTTTLRMIAGLLAPDGGDALICGHSITASARTAKQSLAYVPDEPLLYGKLRPMEYLEFVAGLWNVPVAKAQPLAKDLLKQLGLWAVREDFVETFSRGMKQKLALAGAFMHRPKLVMLDEPLNGLDAAAARLVKTMLLEYVADGNTVILTTHVLDVAERMAQEIGILNKGRLIAAGTLQELRVLSGEAGFGEDGGTLESVFLTLIDQANQESSNQEESSQGGTRQSQADSHE